MKKLLILHLILSGSAYAEPYMNFEMNRIYPKGTYVTTQYEMQIGYRKENEQQSMDVKTRIIHNINDNTKVYIKI